MMNFQEVIILLAIINGLLYIAEGKPKKKTTWRFAFSLDGFPANFLDEDGELVGQSVDMVMKVCGLAKQNCVLDWVDRVDCWNDTSLRSAMLDNDEYDVCANLVESPDRNVNYRFASQNIYDIPDPIIITKLGNEEVTLDSLQTCNDFVLAFPGLTALNRDCLQKAGYFVKEENVLPVIAERSIEAAQEEIVNALNDGRADVAVVIPRLFTRHDDVKTLGPSPCIDTLIGLNMMVTQSGARSDDFLDWWEPTLIQFICGKNKHKGKGKGKTKNNKYRKFCKLMDSIYDVDPLCFTPGVDVNCPGNPLPPPTEAPQPIDPCSS